MGKYKGFAGSGMNANKNMSNVIKQAQKMQAEMEKVQEELEDKVVEGTAGGGAVTATANGKKEILSLKISPDAVDPEDIETLEDLVMVAVNKHPEQLDFMLQKPSLAELESLSKTHLFLMDIGIWLLSDRAVEILMKRSHKESSEELKYYDLYSDFGLALGTHPRIEDEEVNTLSVAILPLPGGEFYHYGTSSFSKPK